MYRMKFGLISALAMAPALPAYAAVEEGPAIPPAQSYAELLDPIPNAQARLRLADEQDAQQPRLIPAQWGYAHHHHHHHHRHYRDAPYWYGPGYDGYAPYYARPGYNLYYGPGIYYRPYYGRHHHHHHHHHHHGYYR